MKTTLECRSLGENKTNYTNANVRQMRQSDLTSSVNTGSHTSRTSYNDDWEHEEPQLSGKSTETSRTGKAVSHTSKRKGVSGGQVVAGVLAGASVGVLAGILLAPEKGKDLRKQVRNSATTLSNKVSKSFSSTKGKVTSWTSKSQTSNKYTNLTSQSSSEVNTMYNDPALGPTGGTNMQRCL